MSPKLNIAVGALAVVLLLAKLCLFTVAQRENAAVF